MDPVYVYIVPYEDILPKYMTHSVFKTFQRKKHDSMNPNALAEVYVAEYSSGTRRGSTKFFIKFNG
jgi:hypothetical protein